MLTEVDTREVDGYTVSLYMLDEQEVYLVCADGHVPMYCYDRARAVQVWQHPLAYMPLQGSVSPPNATEEYSEGQESYGHSVRSDRLRQLIDEYTHRPYDQEREEDWPA